MTAQAPLLRRLARKKKKSALSPTDGAGCEVETWRELFAG